MTQINLLRQVKNLNFPEWFLINWQIVRTVDSWNLTVALKTLAWTDLSTTDPVYCRIGWVVRTITSALSVSANAWTNWFNAGSSELATKEIDYFLFIWYNSSSSLCKIMFWRRATDWQKNITWYIDSMTGVEENYLRTHSDIWTNDTIVNIGRFNAILSAWAWYTWSLPATSVIINRPIYETRELDFVPQFTWSGSMTVSCTPTTHKYIVEWNKCFYKIEQTSITTGWTEATIIYASTPFTSKRFTSWAWQIYNGGYIGTSIVHQQWDNRVSIWSSNSL